MSRPRISPPFETKMEALALVYGPPSRQMVDKGVVLEWFFRTRIPAALAFKEAASKVFSEGEIARVGLHRIARDYTHWYLQQEQNT